MSTFLEPVGPHSPRVYWRRRLVAGGVVLVLLLLLLRACTGGGGDADPQADRSTPAAEESTAPDGDASDAKKATGKPSKTSTARTTAPVRACADGDVEVTARPVEDSFGTGSTVGIRYVVAVKGDVTCRRDVGAAANEVRVLRSGGDLVWSSDHCSPSEQKDVRTLGPYAPYSVLVEWDGSVTPADCPADRLPAPAGEYEVVGRNADVTGPAAALTLG